MNVFLGLIQNLALLFALTFVYGLIGWRLPDLRAGLPLGMHLTVDPSLGYNRVIGIAAAPA